MTSTKLIFRELTHRFGTFLIAVVSTTMAVAAVIGSIEIIGQHDRETRAILEAKKREVKARMEEIRESTDLAMNRLGFHVSIVPENQQLSDWYRDDYAVQTMPEEYVERLRGMELATIEHIVPVLRQKTDWPEKGWTVIVVGTAGVEKQIERFIAMEAERIPRGQMIVGHEIHRSLNLREGQRVTFQGSPFDIMRCARERGTAEDITLWMNLADAQEVLNKKERISQILALECEAAFRDLPRIRTEIESILPDTRVVEQASETLAQAEALGSVEEKYRSALTEEAAMRRDMRGTIVRSAWLINGLALIVCAGWLAGLSYIHVRHRRAEIGILRTLGMTRAFVTRLVGGRLAAAGLAGGLLGYALGAAAARLRAPEWFGGFSAAHVAEAVVLGLLLALAAGYTPLRRALREDPADVLRVE